MRRVRQRRARRGRSAGDADEHTAALRVEALAAGAADGAPGGLRKNKGRPASGALCSRTARESARGGAAAQAPFPAASRETGAGSLFNGGDTRRRPRSTTRLGGEGGGDLDRGRGVHGAHARDHLTVDLELNLRRKKSGGREGGEERLTTSTAPPNSPVARRVRCWKEDAGAGSCRPRCPPPRRTGFRATLARGGRSAGSAAAGFLTCSARLAGAALEEALDGLGDDLRLEERVKGNAEDVAGGVVLGLEWVRGQSEARWFDGGQHR